MRHCCKSPEVPAVHVDVGTRSRTGCNGYIGTDDSGQQLTALAIHEKIDGLS